MGKVIARVILEPVSSRDANYIIERLVQIANTAYCLRP